MRRLLLSCAAATLVALAQPPVRPLGDPVYNPKADAAADVALAVKQAAREGRRVLIDAGGEWCSWCHRMDRFFVEHPDLLALRRKNFVFVKVNYSEENKNQAFFASYPKAAGYPHLFVLDAKGKLLRSQDTAELEEGKSYNLARFTAFLAEWGPKP